MLTTPGSLLIGMVYNRQLLYIHKTHNTENTGGLVYIVPGRETSSLCLFWELLYRKEILAKNTLICWQLASKSANTPLKKNTRENCLNIQENSVTMAHRIPMIPAYSVNTIGTPGQDCGGETLAYIT